MAFGGSLSSTKVPWRGGLVRAGRFDCLTEPGIVGGIVATRTAHLSHPARNDSALRGPRGSFEAACPDQPAPASPSKPFTSCTQRFGRTRPAREFRSGLPGPTRTLLAKQTIHILHAMIQPYEAREGVSKRPGRTDPHPPRQANHSHPARNDSAVRGPRGSFEAAWPDRPAPSSFNQTLTRALSKKNRRFPGGLHPISQGFSYTQFQIRAAATGSPRSSPQASQSPEYPGWSAPHQPGDRRAP